MGVLYEIAMAKRLDHGSDPHHHRKGVGFYVRRGVASISTAMLIGLAILIAWPASNSAVKGADGDTIPGSFAELEAVPLGDHDQWIEIRGVSFDNPVLLWLDGGPVEAGLSLSRIFLADLNADSVVVGWDQRGAGKSYPALDPPSALTLDQAVANTIEPTNHRRERFDEEMIFVAGGSRGSTLGVLAVQQRPDH